MQIANDHDEMTRRLIAIGERQQDMLERVARQHHGRTTYRHPGRRQDHRLIYE